ncbi:hypothetical protein ADK67_43400 [Saccharothrix sp. NRRL B-16348]|uniref:hypothetical protein n=1 Tax=Saccharothrix sp. NRRL B-16348 TaxID=1415542 RepID=UPI0006AFBD53|nr:hypothetical protein [Saccharothrix sp. NRRL B-16348]KOX13821.1 hypothetical protein ADK67_43400 [Saccharothrix sp. NRRL B-16348]
MHHPHDQARGNISHGRRPRRDGHPDPAAARQWLTALAWIGVLTAIVGVTVIGLGMVCDAAPTPDLRSASADGFPGRDPFPGAPIPADHGLDGATATGRETPRSDDVGFGIGLFFTGFALATTAGLGHARRRRRPAGGDRHQVTGSDPTP